MLRRQLCGRVARLPITVAKTATFHTSAAPSPALASTQRARSNALCLVPSRTYHKWDPGEYGEHQVKLEFYWVLFMVLAALHSLLKVISWHWDSIGLRNASDLNESEDPWWDAVHVAYFKGLTARAGRSDDAEDYLREYAPELTDKLVERVRLSLATCSDMYPMPV